MKHIEFEVLIKKAEGLLSPDEAREVEKHLRVCIDCARTSQKLESFTAYVRADTDFEEVPQATTANLLNIFQPQKAAANKDSFLRKLIASLTFDDWQTALNERFVLSDERQLLYKAENFDIDLRLNFAGEKCQLSGQLFPDCAPGTIELFSGEESRKAEFNEDCEFVFPPVKNGQYTLRIKLGETIIEIQNISLQSS